MFSPNNYGEFLKQVRFELSTVSRFLRITEDFFGECLQRLADKDKEIAELKAKLEELTTKIPAEALIPQEGASQSEGASPSENQ